jgi:dUTP pyrophosphatase
LGVQTIDIEGEIHLGAVLSSNEIRALIASGTPLFSGFADLDSQVQANGFDLTLAEVRRFSGTGTIGIDNADRVLPELEPIDADERGFVELTPGAYHITYAETVSLPKDLMALGRPRSSLTRSGVAIHTAVWDAGYSGRSTSLMTVHNSAGFRVQIGARVAQLVFIQLSTPDDIGYQGIYQGENR